MKNRIWVLVSGLFLILGGNALARVPSDNQLIEKVTAADRLLAEFVASPEGIPNHLIDEAKAVVIFPDAVRAGFVFTGQAGQGIALARTSSGGWTAPAFFRMTGMGVGFQLGGEVADLVLVVRTQEGLDALLKDHFTMGTDIAAAAGPGRDLKAATNSKTGILVYGRTKGLFAGVSIEGSVIKQDVAANEAYYGEKVDARQILIENRLRPTDEASHLIETLQRVPSAPHGARSPAAPTV